MSGSASPWLSGSTTGPLVSDLVNDALLQIGVGAQGTTASGVDISSGVRGINYLLAQWQRRRWLVPTLTEYAALSNGAVDYQVGPSAALSGGPTSSTFVTSGYRPDKIEYAFARLLTNGATAQDLGQFDAEQFDPAQFQTAGNVAGIAANGASANVSAPDFAPGDFASTDFTTTPVSAYGFVPSPLAIDYPLVVIPSREDYASISIKNLTTFPSAVYYSPDYPVGNLLVWPVPAYGLWELHIGVKAPLPANLEATTPINLPPEYWDAIVWTLAARLAPSYGQEASPTVVANAKAALQTIRTANTQVPLLALPAALTITRRGSVPGVYIGAGFY